ncbi:ribose transport system substrate-binding protein [Thermoflavimicrobium dichotomicum]|uniref:Ribose transport system substrate-binding protein n=2 Tax=Thermoflavimicrobium dichotomicum TaxID=46223 RepID=A0A1I3V3N8_9BACL|nr:ribose transport system substrate-binding protein [Thermoflavimicrobium dichotomicum]
MSVLLTSVLVFALAACSGPTKSDDGKLTIGLALGTLNNPFFVSMAKGVKEAAKKYNAEVLVEGADYDLAKQTKQIEDFITKNVDLILLNAADSKGIAGAVQQAKAAGIPIVAIDVAAEGGVDATVTSDNYQCGVLAGQYIAKRLNGKGNIIVIDGPPVTSIMDRVQGFKDAIKNSNIKIVAQQNGEAVRDKAQTVAENVLQAHPKGTVNAVFGINDPTALGVATAAQQANRNDFFIVGVDGAPDAVTALKEKKLFAATVAQYPAEMVKTAVDAGIKLVKGQKVDKVIKVPVKLITQENVNQYKGW